MIKKYLQYTEWDIGEKKLVLCVNNRLNRKNARICFKKSENNFVFSKRTGWSVRSHLD